MVGPQPLRNAILIAGPTASGKSAFALDLARRTGGVIVNTDSMQVYSILRTITARPDDAETAQAPHYLYGHVHPSRHYSVGEWVRDVEALIAAGAIGQGPTIFVGGTGLYFRALLGGLSEIPEVDPTIRTKWRDRLLADGPAPLHAELERRDPQAAAGLKPNDGQRIARALEVVDSSGRSILHWQARTGAPLVEPSATRRIVLEADRDVLRGRIAARFDRMIGDGALDEVRAILALGLDPALPAMKAIGVAELGAFLNGRMKLDEAIARAKISTMQYAKRQRTWFRNQFGEDWIRLDAGARDASDGPAS